MTGVHTVRHEFVDTIPDSLEDGIVYVSIRCATAVHLCCCGCESEVVTPLSPTDWSVTFDGQSISLCPSIGNWSFPCQSHYWIQCNRVRWACRWSEAEIAGARRRDTLAKRRQFEPTEAEHEVIGAGRPELRAPQPFHWIERLLRWLRNDR